MVPDPPGGLLDVEAAIRLALGPGNSAAERAPVDALADPHHLADTDPQWAGGDAATDPAAHSWLRPADSRADSSDPGTAGGGDEVGPRRGGQAGSGAEHDISPMTTTTDRQAPGEGLRRRVAVGVTLLAGAVLLAISLGAEPGESSFYWLTLALAAVWAVGAMVSGPVQLGTSYRPMVLGTVVGLGLSVVFVLGALVARLIPDVREYVTAVLEFANQGRLAVVVLITVVNGVAEELFFRGALYTALGPASPGNDLDGDLHRRGDGGRQSDARIRRDPPRCGLRLRTPNDRRRIGAHADPLLLGPDHGAGTAPDLRRLAQRVGPARPGASAPPSLPPRPARHGSSPATRKMDSIETTFDSGPTIANDSGMNASDTKKSRLDTRPSISVGTRRCSSVPQITIPAPSVTPMTERGHRHQRERRRDADDRPAGRSPRPHIAIIVVR